MASFGKQTSLQHLLSPAYIADQIDLPLEQAGDFLVPDSIYKKGFISEDLQWGCNYNEDVIRCFPIVEHHQPFRKVCRSAYTITSRSFKFRKYKNKNVIITCAAEVSLDHLRTCGRKYILLGLEISDDVGALVIYDPHKAKPIKWIKLPSSPRSVTVVSHFEDDVMNYCFNPAMIAMVGIAAVGLIGGDVIIIDLGLDDPEMAPTLQRNEQVKTCKLRFVKPNEPQIAQKRKHYAVKFYTIALLITPDSDIPDYVPEKYFYLAPDKTIIADTEKYAVFVTALSYVPEIGSLIIGFSFGVFQIYRIDNLTLKYSSPMEYGDAPVMSFAFRQPIDDPKNFCYLWVFYGRYDYESDQGFAELFSMLFERKRTLENYGAIYENLKTSQKRLAIQLKDYHYGDGEDSLIRPVCMWNGSDNLTFFVWEAGRLGSYYVGIFDLNQWYSTETPAELRINPINGLCPYWVAINIEANDKSSALWDIRLKPNTFRKWSMPHLDSELHHYPASFTFSLLCLNSLGTFTCDYDGVQERILRMIVTEGHSLLTEPSELVHACRKYGLKPVYDEMYQIENSSPDDQERFFIFSTLLDCRRTTHITCIADKWMDGSYANAGCTIDLIIDWIKRAISTIQSFSEDHWYNLFNFRSSILPPESADYISYSSEAWNDLKGLLHIFMKPKEVYSMRKKIVDESIYIVNKLVLYSRALFLVYQAKILPMSGEFEPMRILKKRYHRRRIEIERDLSNSNFLENEFKECPKLMIDFLVNNLPGDLLEMEWYVPLDLSPLDPKYPPEHPGIILNMLMRSGENKKGEKAISRIVYYFFNDIFNLARMSHNVVRGHLGSLLQLSDIEKDEIDQLWAFDQGDYESASSYLMQRGDLDEKEGLPWFTLIAFLSTIPGQEDRMLSILRSSCPPKLAKLYINLSLAKGCQDYIFDVDFYSTICKDAELLKHFFLEIECKGLLRNFILKNGNNLGELGNSVLESHLKNLISFDGEDLLFLFYILTKNQKDGTELEQKMLVKWNSLQLTPQQQEMFSSKQKMLAQMLKDRNEQNPLKNLLKKAPVCETGKQPKISNLKIRVKKVESTPVNRPDPILLRFKSRHQTEVAFSPLRQFTGFKTRQNEDQELGEADMEEDMDISQSSTITGLKLYDVASILQTPKVNKLNEPTPVSITQQLLSDSTKIQSIIKSDSRTSTPRHIQKIHFNLIDDEEGLDSSSDLRLSIPPSPKETEASTSSENIVQDDESMDIVNEKSIPVEKVREIPLPFDDESIEAGPFFAGINNGSNMMQTSTINRASVSLSESTVSVSTPKPAFAEISALRLSSPIAVNIADSEDEVKDTSLIEISDDSVIIEQSPPIVEEISSRKTLDELFKQTTQNEKIQIRETIHEVFKDAIEEFKESEEIVEEPLVVPVPIVESAHIEETSPFELTEEDENEESINDECFEKIPAQKQVPAIFDTTTVFELSLDASTGEFKSLDTTHTSEQMEEALESQSVPETNISTLKKVNKLEESPIIETIPEKIVPAKGRKRKTSAKESQAKILKTSFEEDQDELILDASQRDLEPDDLPIPETRSSKRKNEVVKADEPRTNRRGKSKTPVPMPEPISVSPKQRKRSTKTSESPEVIQKDEIFRTRVSKSRTPEVETTRQTLRSKKMSESPEVIQKDESFRTRVSKSRTPDVETARPILRSRKMSESPEVIQKEESFRTRVSKSRTPDVEIARPTLRPRRTRKRSESCEEPTSLPPYVETADNPSTAPTKDSQQESQQEEEIVAKKPKRGRPRKDSESEQADSRGTSVDPELGDSRVEKPRKKAKQEEGKLADISVSLRTRSKAGPASKTNKTKLVEEILPMLASSVKEKKKASSTKGFSPLDEEGSRNVFNDFTVSPLKETDADDNLFDSQTLGEPSHRRVKKMDLSDSSLSQSLVSSTTGKRGRKRSEEPLDFEIFKEMDESTLERSYATRSRRKTPVPSTSTSTSPTKTRSRKKSTDSPDSQKGSPSIEPKTKGRTRKKSTDSIGQPAEELNVLRTTRRRKTPTPEPSTSTIATRKGKAKQNVETEVEEEPPRQRRLSGRKSADPLSPKKKEKRTRRAASEEPPIEEDESDREERAIAEVMRKKGTKRLAQFNLNLSTVIEVSGADLSQMASTLEEMTESPVTPTMPVLSLAPTAPTIKLRSRTVSQPVEEKEPVEATSKRSKKITSDADVSISRRTRNRSGSVASSSSKN